jgi:ATP-dependent phosphofructokinase / diphosphate-dependent phosphofructokinase
VISLDPQSVRGITHLGGTILGTTNRGNPFEWPTAQPDGTVTVDRSDEVLRGFAERNRRAHRHRRRRHTANRTGSRTEGLPVVGVPKTIDNDLAVTQVTFGFHTAVQTATDAVDKLHSTAESHERVMVVEVMGRNTGWIALHSGISGTADVILIPEIPYDIEKVCAKIEARYPWPQLRHRRGCGRRGIRWVARSRGAGGRTAGRGQALRRHRRTLAHAISERTGRETRTLVLGHLQRGGSPTAYDRLIALRFGAAAVRCVADRQFGTMVALEPPVINAVPLEDAIRQIKTVPLDSDTVLTARALGISLGD